MDRKWQYKHLSTIAKSLKEMATQSLMCIPQSNKELTIMGANGALQFFLEENDHAKAAEMAMIMYNGAKEAALAAQPS